jgi:hypothetical protein
VKRALTIVALSALFMGGCGTEGIGSQQGEAIAGQDSLNKPTDTHVELEPGLWHDNELVPGEGWHLYHFVPETSGWVSFQMQAPKGHANLWSYLRIVEPEHNNEVWAGVGNKRTNLCEVIVYADAGHDYDVIVTSQENSLLINGESQFTDGPYTVGVLPVDVTFAD